MKKTLILSLPLLLAITANTAPITPGNLVVVRVGDGSAGLTANATAGFLMEYTTTGSFVQTIPLPTAVSGLNNPLTFSGSATSEGFVTISANGQYLTLAGYAAVPGTTSPQTQTATAVNRVVGRVDLSGNIDTSTALNDAYNGSNIRSAVSTDGTDLWTSGNGGSGQGASAATRYTTLGSTASTVLHTTASNMRVANIFNGQLYVSSSTSSGGGLYGVATVGTGLPTSGDQTPVALPGTWISGTHSVYDFWFKDANTLYMADDGSAANLGGIQKWTLSGGTWSLQYTLLNSGTATTAVRGLAGTVDTDGNAVLFATTTTSSANNLIKVTDTGASATATVLATAPTSTVFRGVEFIPEPSSIALLFAGLAGLVLFLRRR